MNAGDLNSEKPLVLIIDDDDTTRMMAIGFLSQAGFELREAENGGAALSIVSEISPDLIVLDVEMPAMDGFEVCANLRKLRGFEHTPILMLTGYENDEYIHKAYDAGATDFASKPINWSLLSHRLKYLYRTRLAADQLLNEQARLADAQRIAQMGSWKYDHRTQLCEWSDQLFRILGYEPNECIPNMQNSWELVHNDDKKRAGRWFNQILHSTTASSIEHRIVLKDRSLKHICQQVEPELDSSGRVIGLSAVVQDYTERRRVEEKVHRLAYYDALTDLPNRILFHEQLTLAMERAREYQQKLAVLYFDLDDFKRINDTFGHAIGDKLLYEVGDRLTKSLRISASVADQKTASDIIARMGGDEFIIIINNIVSARDAEVVAQRVLSVVSEPYDVGGYELYTSPSVGISVYPEDGEVADVLMKSADMAMYEAKRLGKNLYVAHNEAMEEKALRRYNIDAQMRTALENDEFSVNYQVQVDLASGQIFSAEALVRWHNEQLGFVSPGEFIPVAEDNGLIIAIGEWVLRQSCHQAKSWMDSAFEVPRIAVNISVMQFMRSNFCDMVSQVLNESGLPAHCLELEITESLLASDINHAIDTLQALNSLGVKLSIDDFGTGYSSLSQLKHFPIDRLKIDQSFIKNVTENSHDAGITRAVIAMAESMNIKVLAEGVETKAHFDFLVENGCDEFQGYLISKPVSAAQLKDDMPALQIQLDALFGSNSRISLKIAS